MRLGRRWHWWRAVEVIVMVVCLAAVADRPVLAQGRSPTAGPAVANGRGAGTGRQAAGQLVPVRTDRCPAGAATCDRVVQAFESRPFPTLLAGGDVLRTFARDAASLVVLVCPCGRSCLDFNSFGWVERNLGRRGPSGAAGVDVPINFHFARDVSRYLLSIERLDFRVKWAITIDGSGNTMLSQDITSYGGSRPSAGAAPTGTATPLPAAGVCP